MKMEDPNFEIRIDEEIVFNMERTLTGSAKAGRGTSEEDEIQSANQDNRTEVESVCGNESPENTKTDFRQSEDEEESNDEENFRVSSYTVINVFAPCVVALDVSIHDMSIGKKPPQADEELADGEEPSSDEEPLANDEVLRSDCKKSLPDSEESIPNEQPTEPLADREHLLTDLGILLSSNGLPLSPLSGDKEKLADDVHYFPTCRFSINLLMYVVLLHIIVILQRVPRNASQNLLFTDRTTPP
jgi:hypothetical protein